MKCQQTLDCLQKNEEISTLKNKYKKKCFDLEQRKIIEDLNDENRVREFEQKLERVKNTRTTLFIIIHILIISLIYMIFPVPFSDE